MITAAIVLMLGLAGQIASFTDNTPTTTAFRRGQGFYRGVPAIIPGLRLV